MKKLFLLFLLLSFTVVVFAQKRVKYYKPLSTFNKNTDRILTTSGTEICDNAIDDDDNGLTDGDDFACFFISSNSSCLQNKIIWGVSYYGLYWANMETGTTKYVGATGNKVMFDITWAKDGKLYGVDANNEGIWEIDPNTASIQFKSSLPGYYTGNSLTADEEGNLYLDVYTDNEFHIIKIDIATWEATIIAYMTGANFYSGGDLIFLNGFLYLAGDQEKIAKIDVTTGTFQIFPLINSPIYEIRGITSIGDGYLYFSAIDKLYRLDPVTMIVDSNPQYSFPYPDIDLLGLANYTQTCKISSCTAKVSITNYSLPPYCTNIGVQLVAKGTGITGPAAYEWHTPKGDTLSADTLIATTLGKYFVKYYTTDGSCAAIDSLIIQVNDTCICRPFLPLANLGTDKEICSDDILIITNLAHREGFQYSWQDGTSGKSMVVKNGGWYWSDVSTSCGIVRDSILVVQMNYGCEKRIFFPNAFTPNGDGKNDQYSPIVNGPLKTYELTIYNRWGKIVFNTKKPGDKWDGKVNGQRDKASTFVCFCRYQFEGEESKLYKGVVVMIR